MEDALVYARHAEAQHGVRVAKRKRKTKGLEVTFDARARKDYLTGFGKRKLQRRKDALRCAWSTNQMMLITMYAIHSQAAEKDRQQRAQDKAELKEALQLDRYALPAETAEPAAPQADVFEAPQYTTIVTTQAMAEGSSDEEAQPDGGGPRDEGSSLGAVQAAVRQQRQAKRAAEAQRTARQAARRQDKKLMQQLKAAKARKKKKKKR